MLTLTSKDFEAAKSRPEDFIILKDSDSAPRIVRKSDLKPEPVWIKLVAAIVTALLCYLLYLWNMAH